MKKDTTNDMTVGSPVSLIIKFMIPMCLGNLFQQFYNIADSIVAGKFIGVNALAAIGSTGSLMFFVTGWLNGLSSGFAIIVAQMFGAKKFDRMRHYVAMSIYLMAAFSIVMTIGFSLANKPILHLMNSPEEVFGDVTGKSVLIADDICDGGRTFIELAKVLKERGAAHIHLHVTHGIFSKGKAVFEGLIDTVTSTYDYEEMFK